MNPGIQEPRRPVAEPFKSGANGSAEDRWAAPAAPRMAAVLEIAIAAALTAAALALHLRFFFSAGPLWRDEAASVAVATTPTLHDLWTHLQFDSFPVVWEIILRLWVRLGPGSSDRSIRLLGLLVGLGIVAVLWRNARAMGARSPVVALALLEFTGITVFYGDSLRGYGPGMLLGLISFGAIWNLARSPSPMRGAAALLASLLSVHVLFYNSVWLLAACCGGAVVCALHRRWRAGAAIVGIGVVCGASMLIYLPMIRGRAAFGPVLVHVTTPWVVYTQLGAALEGTPVGAIIPIEKLIWAVGLAAAVVAGAFGWIVRSPWRSPAAPNNAIAADATAFCSITLLVGVVAYVAFLIALKNYMQSWYFLAGMAMVAGCIDALLAAAPLPRARLLLGIVLAAAAAWCFPAAWHSASVRMSNIDRAADELRALAQPEDLVILTPWWLDQSFVRYDHGRAPLLTLPPIPDLRYARYDRVVAAMSDPAAVDAVLAQAAGTLRGGHRVWIVNVPSFSLFFPDPARLRKPRSAWHDGEFFQIWNTRLADLLQRHASATRILPLRTDADVHRMENVQLYEADGWRD